MSSSRGNLDASIFVNKLKESLKFESLYENFNEILKSHKALIAGGCVLSAYTGFDMNDIDIYVHQSYASSMFSKLNSLGFNVESSNVAPSYDASFLKKNNIQTRLNLLLRYGENYVDAIEIDLMIIPSHIPLVNVILNFDLSFCKIWYNGTSVYANNLIEIEKKEGYLGKDYVHKLFTELNTFTWFRLKKYIKRGFKIQFEELYNSKNVGNLINQKNTTLLNTDAIKEEWFVKYIIRNLFKSGIFKKLGDAHTLRIIDKDGYSVIVYVNSIYKDNPDMYFTNYNRIAYLASNMKDFTVESLKTAFKLTNILELIDKTKKNVSFKGILLYIIFKKYYNKYNKSVTPYDSIKNNVEYKEIVLKYLDIPENILNILSNYDNDKLLLYGSSIKFNKIIEKLLKLNIKYANIKQLIDSKLENIPVGNATNAARQKKYLNKMIKEAAKLNHEIISTDKKFKNYLNKEESFELEKNSAPTVPLHPPPSPPPKKAFSSPRNKQRMLAKIPNRPKSDSVILNSNDTPEIDPLLLDSSDPIRKNNYVYLQGKYYNKKNLRDWLLRELNNYSTHMIKVPHNNLPLRYVDVKLILSSDEMSARENIIRQKTMSQLDEVILQEPPHIKKAKEKAKERFLSQKINLHSNTTSPINETPPSWLPPRRNTAAPAGPAGPAGP